MKNFTKIILTIYLVALIPSTLYLYSTNKSISTNLKNNDEIRVKIESLDKFKSDVVDMAIMSKYYLITGQSYYNDSFENSYITASNNLDKLYNSNYISEEDNNVLHQNLDNYRKIAKNNSDSVNAMNIDPKVESQILELTNIETGILEDTSSAFYSSIKTTQDNSGTAMELVDSQNSILQMIGGIITMIFLSPIYFITKNSKMFFEMIKNILPAHMSKEDKSPTDSEKKNKCDDAMLQCINNSIIKNFEEKIDDRNLLISTLRIIYSHSEYMTKEWEDGKVILDSIENDLSDLKHELEGLIDNSEIPYEKLNIIENKFLEVKFLLEKLPGYHEFIMKLTEKY